MSSATPVPRDPAIGQVVLGRYRLVRFLARGGMGSIYLGRVEGAAGFARPVVIKRALHAGDTQAAKLFAREARILARLRHPAIVSILDFADTGGEYVMALEYVHGYTLGDWVRYARRRGAQLSIGEALWPVLRVLDALAYAHALTDDDGSPLGIVHRDIKPSNVLIDVQGEVKLADFGIARTAEEATETSLTDVSIKGTLPFMAPELFAKATPGAITDTYSAAVMLYSALVGKNPFSEQDAAMTIGRVVNFEPPLLHELREDAPPTLSRVLQRAMAKTTQGRFQTASELAAALAGAVTEPLTEIEAAFRAGVKRDFEDAHMAEVLGVAGLRERAAALQDSSAPKRFPTKGDVSNSGPLDVSPLSATGVASLANGPMPSSGGALPDIAAESLTYVRPPPPPPPGDVGEQPTRILHGERASAAATAERAAIRDATAERAALSATPTPLPAVLTPVGGSSPFGDSRADAGAVASVSTARVGRLEPEGAPRRRGPVVAAAVLVAAGGIAAAVAVIATRGGAPPAPEMVVVRGDVSLEADAGAARDAAAPAAVPVDAGAAAVVAPEAPADAGSEGFRPTPRGTPDYADAVRRRQGAIASCIETHARGITGTPELAVRLGIDKSGAVTSAELLPDSLAGTPLGACVLQVVRGTKFGPQKAPVVVRIPLTVRTR